MANRTLWICDRSEKIVITEDQNTLPNEWTKSIFGLLCDTCTKEVKDFIASGSKGTITQTINDLDSGSLIPTLTPIAKETVETIPVETAESVDVKPISDEPII